jgi:hypothetical protein
MKVTLRITIMHRGYPTGEVVTVEDEADSSSLPAVGDTIVTGQPLAEGCGPARVVRRSWLAASVAPLHPTAALLECEAWRMPTDEEIEAMAGPEKPARRPKR